MVEEIITALSRFDELFVIARNSSFTYKGRAVDVKQVARDLGVRYVLEGSVRRCGSRLRIMAQLIDASVGTHLWADGFEGGLETIFELQDQVASRVAGTIGSKFRSPDLTGISRTLRRDQFVDQAQIGAGKKGFSGVDLVTEMPDRHVRR
jgi:adenylate cyclase